MTDDNNTTPEQQEPTSGQQAGDNQSTDSTDWEARFKGLQRKYNALVEAKSELEAQLSDLTSAKDGLEKKLDTLSVEKDTLITDNKRKFDELTKTLTEREQELEKLSSYQKKVQVARELGHPELIRVLDVIPDTTDEDVLKDSFKSIIELANDAVKQREEQLAEGLSPGAADSDGTPMPTTEQGWKEYIEGLPLGSPERQKAYDTWFNTFGEG